MESGLVDMWLESLERLANTRQSGTAWGTRLAYDTAAAADELTGYLFDTWAGRAELRERAT